MSEPTLTASTLRRAALRWLLPGSALGVLGLFASPVAGLVGLFGFGPLAAVAVVERWAQNRPGTTVGGWAACVTVLGLGVVAVQAVYLTEWLQKGAGFDTALLAGVRFGFTSPELWLGAALASLPVGLASRMRVERQRDPGTRHEEVVLLFVGLVMLFMAAGACSPVGIAGAAVGAACGLAFPFATLCLLNLYDWVDTLVERWEARRA